MHQTCAHQRHQQWLYRLSMMHAATTTTTATTTAASFMFTLSTDCPRKSSSKPLTHSQMNASSVSNVNFICQVTPVRLYWLRTPSFACYKKRLTCVCVRTRALAVVLCARSVTWFLRKHVTDDEVLQIIIAKGSVWVATVRGVFITSALHAAFYHHHHHHHHHSKHHYHHVVVVVVVVAVFALYSSARKFPGRKFQNVSLHTGSAALVLLS